MHWPAEILLIRHAESAYNALKRQMADDHEYQQFKQLNKQEPLSSESKRLAELLSDRYPAAVSDISTPLTKEGLEQSYRLGSFLRSTQSLPDMVYVSPYLRTWSTLSGVFASWPELAKVRLIEDERLREQEFGQRLLYSDWRFYFAQRPEQQALLQMQGSYWYRYLQGESIPDVRQRVRSWTNTICRDLAGKRVLVFTHHVSILALRANIERLNSQAFLDLDRHHKPDNGSITTYTCDSTSRSERLQLQHYNQLPLVSGATN